MMDAHLDLTRFYVEKFRVALRDLGLEKIARPFELHEYFTLRMV